MNRSAFHREEIRRVVAGVSGGADSVALLRAYLEAGVDITVVHCNFHLRGEESERDRRFVEGLCNRLGVRMRIAEFDVEAYMALNCCSMEMACRELRYEEFRKVKAETRADRIAVAHNSDDNAETLLLNLMRGAGVKGLRGMIEDTGEIIRPLLNVSRAEILEYLDEIGQDYVIDSTNLSSDYRRNFIRNRVLPLLETEWPGARTSILRTIRNLRQEELALDDFESRLCGEDTAILRYSDIFGCAEPAWLIRRFAVRHCANETQAQEMTRCVSDSDFTSGKYWTTPRGTIRAERDRLEFNTGEKQLLTFDCFKVRVTQEVLAQIRRSPLSELWTTLGAGEVEFRHVRQGDRIEPLGMRGSVKVSKILKDAKLSGARKESTTVAVSRRDGAIIWIPGLKRSRRHLVTDTSEYAFKYVELKEE